MSKHFRATDRSSSHASLRCNTAGWVDQDAQCRAVGDETGLQDVAKTCEKLLAALLYLCWAVGLFGSSGQVRREIDRQHHRRHPAFNE